MEAAILKLPPTEQELVRAIARQFALDLCADLPQIRASVQTAEAQGSFSVTLDVKKSKKNRFKALLRPRVRAPREPTEFDMHVNDDGQLALGFGPEPAEGEGGEGGQSSE